VLDDLENGILRGNAPGAASLGMLLKLPWLSQGPFKQGDPRAHHVRQMWGCAGGGVPGMHLYHRLVACLQGTEWLCQSEHGCVHVYVGHASACATQASPVPAWPFAFA
jgi:hypothetical protein